MIRRIEILLLAAALLAAPLLAQDKKKAKDEERLTDAGVVMKEILDIPEDIPQDLLDKAECVVVFPSVVKAAFIVGGQYGHGAMVCRGGKDYTGSWGAPAMYALEGASVGFQIGAQASDFVLMIMNSRGVDSLLNSKVKLGADASVAAGPKGRQASTETDAYLRAEILTYSRSRGLFAGISLEGSTVRPDDDANMRVYGHAVTAREIVQGGEVSTPESGRALVSRLQTASPRNLSDQQAAAK